MFYICQSPDGYLQKAGSRLCRRAFARRFGDIHGQQRCAQHKGKAEREQGS